LKLYLSLGSNRGNKQQNLDFACHEINKQLGIVTKTSTIIETEPWGYSDSETYLNNAIEVETSFPIKAILEITQKIEKDLGRTQKTTINKNGSPCYTGRTIDIDIIFADDLVIKSETLTIPHKEMHKRDFVLAPLAEIAPDLIHPVFDKSVLKLQEKLRSN